MPLFKGVASLAKPKKAIEYITKDEKAVIISSLSLDNTRDYAIQFKETCDLFGKCTGRGERKYYHFKLSCDPKDNPTPQQSHDLAEQIASKLFHGHECVIATHADTDVFHSHIIINAVNFETGKKFRMWNGAYGEAKDLADILGEKMGFTKLEWRAKTEDKRNKILADEAITSENKHLSNAERNIAKRDTEGSQSWKEALRQAIDDAKSYCTDRAMFQKYLKDTYDIDMPRNTAKTVSFIHPGRMGEQGTKCPTSPIVGETKAIRGTKLGSAYTAESIDRALNENRERIVQNARLFTSKEDYTDSRTTTSTNNAVITSQPTTQTGDRERTTPRSISDISTELREIDATVQSVVDGNNTNIVNNESISSRATGSDKRQRQEPSKPVEVTGEPKSNLSQKPKRSSKTHQR